MQYIKRFYKDTFNFNFFKLLFRIFFIIKNSKRNKNFFILIIVVCFQAILDVISLASIIPLIFLIQEKSLVNQNLNNYINKFGLDAQFLLVKDDLYMYLPIIVILIIIVSTIFRIFLLYKTNNFIENIRHSISNK